MVAISIRRAHDVQEGSFHSTIATDGGSISRIIRSLGCTRPPLIINEVMPAELTVDALRASWVHRAWRRSSVQLPLSPYPERIITANMLDMEVAATDVRALPCPWEQ
jgi:hypothetical protein